ncbi:MAG: GNAT family N-acetyltransferase [Clostridiales bacterium]|nr:GNAT family N-acetyltransferase [Clostridiales bacterium]
MKYRFERLDDNVFDDIRDLFVSVFSREPWNDDWSDEDQLRAYIHDLTGQSNSLAFGMYNGDELIGISLGHIRHWYTGTEYFIDELCISTSEQGKGIGTLFVNEIEKACSELGLTHIFLLTDHNVPAYEFYKKRGFHELESNAAFAKKISPYRAE